MNLTVEAWIAREFTPDSAPAKHTVWKWLREGKIPATKQGKRYYIPASFRLAAQTGNPLADRVLNPS